MPNFRQRKWFLIGIAIAIVIVLTLVAAPNSGGRRNSSGSTYGKDADGYGAWYEYMSQREIPIQRWRKPFSQLVKDDRSGTTYVQILSKADFIASAIDLSPTKSNWVARGNTLVIIGKYQPATAAPFESSIPYRQQTLSNNQIKIATTRRYQSQQKNRTKNILEDSYGAVVWQERIGKGEVIYCTTPYLAANAYQNYPDNYQFLAELVDRRQTILVDEYIHGYKDRETIAQEQQTDILSYLAKTPWYLLFIQTVLIAIIAAITAFRRFGLPQEPKTTIADNSTAYINALAGVLEKAKSTDFVVEAIAKDEQLKLQKSLGLGKSLVDRESLIATCQQQGIDLDLNQILEPGKGNEKISDAQLITWLQKWQKINHSDRET